MIEDRAGDDAEEIENGPWGGGGDGSGDRDGTRDMDERQKI